LFSCKQNQLNRFAPVQLEFDIISKFLVENFRCNLFTPSRLLSLGRHSHSLALLGLTPGVDASWFGAAPAGLLSPLACSLPIYLAVYYLCRL
jgi:hypothetical protein